MRRIPYLGAAVVFMGCAFGQVAPVTAPTHFALAVGGGGALAVAVWDQREDVVSGDDKETIVGHQRSLYGIPYAVQNASGRPFAHDFAELIARALRENQREVKVVHVSPFKRESAVIDALVASEAERLLLFKVVEWDADTYSETTLHYDIELSVLDRRGERLTSSSVKGEDELKARGRAERRDVAVATADIIQTLLTEKPVIAALSNEAETASKTCTVDQILKMRESGLSQSQIEAACGGG